MTPTVMENDAVRASPHPIGPENLFGMFFGRPISMAIIAFMLFGLFFPLISKRIRLKRLQKALVE